MLFLDRFNVLLLDINGTFMFEQDRFGPNEDYFATYSALGGRALSRCQVHAIVETTFDAMIRDYNNPERFDDFPSVSEALIGYGGAPEAECTILGNVFAAHEMGSVAPACQDLLHRRARTQHLGVVSNLFARPEPWLNYLRGVNLLPLFRTLVFSSEGRSIKPSRRIFERALSAVAIDSAILLIGDSLERDIIPAKALGLTTAWVSPDGGTNPAADVVVPHLRVLDQLSVTD